MLPDSDIIVNAANWTLTAAGLLFGGRSILRNRREKDRKPVPPP